LETSKAKTLVFKITIVDQIQPRWNKMKIFLQRSTEESRLNSVRKPTAAATFVVFGISMIFVRQKMSESDSKSKIWFSVTYTKASPTSPREASA
jgi:hypothetical protein